MQISEQQLITWSKPISTIEDSKCQNAVSQVTKAIRNKFGSSVSIFLQGSYRNNTNIRLDSDVDIVVKYGNVFRYDVSSLDESERKSFHETFSNSEYTFSQFKNEIEQILEDTFEGAVQRKNKCIKLSGNTNRVNADVIPCFNYRRFSSATGVSAEGISFDCDDRERIHSFPEQHYTNGVQKTEQTARMYKRSVRILKNMRNKLIESNIISKELVSSFFIECLVWNVPNSNFFSNNYFEVFRKVTSVLVEDMKIKAKYDQYAEVSDLKWLFRGGKRTPEDALFFMSKCLELAGIKK